MMFGQQFNKVLWIGIIGVAIAVGGCQDRIEAPPPETPTGATEISLSEVAPPAAIARLSEEIDVRQPQVTILSPEPDAVIEDTKVELRVQVRDLPTFKDPDLGLGPHLHVILDNEPYRAVYNVEEPIVFEDLAPGSHTLRLFASRPWHESFKNDGAYAQTTFHLFAKTNDNRPTPGEPLLTYSRPKGSYGAEPIMLDFYLSDAPLKLEAFDPGSDDEAVGQADNWRIRVTINGESFLLDRWMPVYLKGFNPGRNWVELELLDSEGNLIDNEFNSTVRLIEYQPGGEDTLSKLVRGELAPQLARSIIDPQARTPQAVEETPTGVPEVLPEEEASEPEAQPAPPTEEMEPTAEEEGDEETEATASQTQTPTEEESAPEEAPVGEETEATVSQTQTPTEEGDRAEEAAIAGEALVIEETDSSSSDEPDPLADNGEAPTRDRDETQANKPDISPAPESQESETEAVSEEQSPEPGAPGEEENLEYEPPSIESVTPPTLSPTVPRSQQESSRQRESPLLPPEQETLPEIVEGQPTPEDVEPAAPQQEEQPEVVTPETELQPTLPSEPPAPEPETEAEATPLSESPAPDGD